MEYVFVVQKHEASRLHYDFRLQVQGVLKSWAVPKGPSLAPSVKRLAVLVEDHPLEYRDFEGTIAEGEYGAGVVMIWDEGTVEWDAGKDPVEMFGAGLLEFELRGRKLKGRFKLVQTKMNGDARNWLLVKRRDDDAEEKDDLLSREPNSARTGRTMEQIAADAPGS
jgi:bifunctional non-homologous end joining protein LigD